MNMSRHQKIVSLFDEHHFIGLKQREEDLRERSKNLEENNAKQQSEFRVKHEELRSF